MVKIYNSEVTRGLAKNARIAESKDKVPDELAEKIVPTLETNPALLRRCNIVRSGVTTAANSVVYTTPTDRDFFLVGATLSMSKEAADSNTNVSLVLTPYYNYGTTFSMALLYITGATLTASHDNQSLSLPTPLLLARGSTITITKVAGNSNCAATIVGYTTED